jgi:hypothetical protein
VTNEQVFDSPSLRGSSAGKAALATLAPLFPRTGHTLSIFKVPPAPLTPSFIHHFLKVTTLTSHLVMTVLSSPGPIYPSASGLRDDQRLSVTILSPAAGGCSTASWSLLPSCCQNMLSATLVRSPRYSIFMPKVKTPKREQV